MLALGHLLRGHVTEVFGHVRRAIEGAAIGNLIKSEPDIADLFRNSSRKEYKDRTTTGKILPKKGSALTQTLNEMVDTASKRLHNNFESYEKRLTESFSVDQSGYHYKNELFTHEIAADTLDYFLSVAVWLLRAEERVWRLIAESFDVTGGEWHQLLSEFTANIERFEQSVGILAD